MRVQVLSNGQEVRLQRNALQVISRPTGDESVSLLRLRCALACSLRLPGLNCCRGRCELPGVSAAITGPVFCSDFRISRTRRKRCTANIPQVGPQPLSRNNVWAVAFPRAQERGQTPMAAIALPADQNACRRAGWSWRRRPKAPSPPGPRRSVCTDCGSLPCHPCSQLQFLSRLYRL